MTTQEQRPAHKPQGGSGGSDTSRPWPVRWWLIGLMMATSLPLLVLALAGIAVQVRLAREDARSSVSRISSHVATDLREKAAASQRLVAVLAAELALQPQARTFCRVMERSLPPGESRLILLGADGELICATGERLLTAEEESGLLPTINADGRPRLVLSQQRLLLLTVRKNERRSETLVALLAPLGADDVLTPGAVLTLIDEAGKILYRSQDSARWVGKTIRGSEVTELILAAGTGRAEAQGLDGVPRQYGFNAMPELEAFVYSGTPTVQVMRPVRHLIVQWSVGGVVLLSLLTVAASMLARRIEKPIASLVNATRARARGEAVNLRPHGPLEICELTTAFNQMAERQVESEATVRRSEQALRSLSDRLLVIQEKERTRIARELHDDLGQLLTALKMDIGGLLRTEMSEERKGQLVARLESTLDETVESIQRISAELRPGALDDLGLIAALESEARLFEERSGIEVELSLDEVRLERAVETAIFRITHEVLTNTARHAAASRVEIRLRQRDRDVLLEVRDNGVGVSDEKLADPQSLGLTSIRERATLAGGEADIRGITGRGTIVTVRVPAAEGDA